MGEEDFALQSKVSREYRQGPDPEEVALQAVAEVAPKDILEVGPGDGAFAGRLARSLGVNIVAVDTSPRMVELARSRGIDARIGDVRDLALPNESFDCAIANWMLYLAPDPDRALAELARVLRPGGRLVAGTVAKETFAEVRELLGGIDPPTYSFSAETGADLLRRYFSRVERRDVEGTVVFPDWESLREFVAMAPTRARLADRIPPFRGSFATRSHLAVFVADK